RGVPKPEILSHLNSRLGIPRICVDPTHRRATPCSSTLSLRLATLPCTHMRGLPRICVPFNLKLSPTSPFNPTITHHPRICVHASAYAWDSPPLHPLTQPSLTTHAYAYMPTHMRGTLTHFTPTITHHPRICVHAYAYAWDSHLMVPLYPLTHITTQPTPPAYFLSPPSSHAYACHPTHMHGNQTLPPAHHSSAHKGNPPPTTTKPNTPRISCSPLPPSTHKTEPNPTSSPLFYLLQNHSTVLFSA
ncbi:hypothetical protein PIB30_106069, partial [Stylosanthes scabra]|nr:hypothetical protein [Stylosanthes scabra]